MVTNEKAAKFLNEIVNTKFINNVLDFVAQYIEKLASIAENEGISLSNLLIDEWEDKIDGRIFYNQSRNADLNVIVDNIGEAFLLNTVTFNEKIKPYFSGIINFHMKRLNEESFNRVIEMLINPIKSIFYKSLRYEGLTTMAFDRLLDAIVFKIWNLMTDHLFSEGMTAEFQQTANKIFTICQKYTSLEEYKIYLGNEYKQEKQQSQEDNQTFDKFIIRKTCRAAKAKDLFTSQEIDEIKTLVQNMLDSYGLDSSNSLSDLNTVIPTRVSFSGTITNITNITNFPENTFFSEETNTGTGTRRNKNQFFEKVNVQTTCVRKKSLGDRDVTPHPLPGFTHNVNKP
jgi:hypothetical protein